MANLTIRVLAATTIPVLQFTPIVDANPYIREQDNVREYQLYYQNGSGQNIEQDSVLFTYSTNGSSFVVKANESKALSGNGFILISVVAIPNATESNGNIMSFTLHNASVSITISYDSLPITEDIYVKVNDDTRSYVFSESDFVNKYYDYDGDPLTRIIITPTTDYLATCNHQNGLFFNNQLITQSIIVSMNEIRQGLLVANSQEVNGIYSLTLDWDYYKQ